MANDIDKTSPHYKGEFGSIYEVNQKFPSGGVEGDYVAIDGWAHYWNADRGTWCVNAQRDSYWDELITGIIEKFKLFKGATYMGVAGLDTVPAKAIGAKMYYFATVAGTYKNFGGLVVPQGINVLYSENGSSWVCSTLLEVAQELGVSTRMVVSQKVVNDALNLKANQSSVNEALAKKADKETVDIELGKKANKADMDVELGKKFDKESVAQESGDSEVLVMSQKAVSDKLNNLSTKVKNVENENTSEENDAVEIYDNNGNLKHAIDESHANFTNLQSNGKKVLTEHQDISGKADKKYVDDELTKKQYVIRAISTEKTTDSEETIIIHDNSEQKIMELTREGLAAKDFKLIDGNKKFSEIINLINTEYYDYVHRDYLESSDVYRIAVNTINGSESMSEKTLTTKFIKLISNIFWCNFGWTNYNGTKLSIRVLFYNADKTFISGYEKHQLNRNIKVPDGAEYVRFSILKYDTFLPEEIDDLKFSVKPYKQVARKVRFDYPTDYIDYSKELTDMKFINSPETILEQVYSKFDTLASSNSDYITELDAAEIAGLTYPSYCNLNGEANGEYLATPSYTIKVWKLSMNNDSLYKGILGRKIKVLMVSGEHGNEISSPYNLYLFAKSLCERYNVDRDILALRTNFEFYFIPCLSGYSQYHQLRGNANGVNIMRNFPTYNWRVSGEETKTSQYGNEYSGKEAASEFETQIEINIVKKLGIDAVFGFHNYDHATNRSFYIITNNKDMTQACMKSCVDVKFAQIKNMPNVFGNNADIVTKPYSPSALAEEEGYFGIPSIYFEEYGLKCAATIEISNGLSYSNGKFDSTITPYTSEFFMTSEYMIRNCISHLLEDLTKLYNI